MPVNTNLLERLVLYRLHRGPAPMFDLLGAASFSAVTLARDLGLFEALARAPAPLPPRPPADRIDAHPEAVATLCDFLVTEGYLAIEDDRYRLTRMTETWLTADSGTDLGP